MISNAAFSRPVIAVVILLPLAGCSDDTGRPQRPPADEAIRRDYPGRIRDVAQSYEQYGPLDSAAQWANTLCLPITSEPPTHFPHYSDSGDGDTHGRKMYWLFVRDRDAYAASVLHGRPSPAGQVVVKESWLPEEVDRATTAIRPIKRTVTVGGQRRVDILMPFARKDSRYYRARARGPLFVMLKLDPATPDTDDGWVYGTVTADGETVLSAGRVASCMGCHRDAPHDRLFGDGKR